MSKSSIYQQAGLSRQGFHQALHRLEAKKKLEQEVLSAVRQFRAKRPKIESRTMYHMLGINQMGINRFERLLPDHQLSLPIKCKYIRTTYGVREEADHNLISGLVLDGINQVVAGYYKVSEKWYYIFTLKDLYSKYVVGLGGYKQMHAEYAIKVPKQAILERGAENFRGTIHHTDAGRQYKSTAYKSLLNICNMRMSIAENCLQNGMAEQLNYIVKDHYLYNYEIKSEWQLNKILTEIKYELNYKRPVKALGYKTPYAFE